MIHAKEGGFQVVVLPSPPTNTQDTPAGLFPILEHFLIRHLERLPAGTTYPEIARRFGEVARGVSDKTGSRPEIFVYATGMGQPLMDEVKRHGDYSRVRPVYFNHGDRRAEEGGEVRLGKGWLVCRLQMLLQTHQVHLPRSEEAETLAEELMAYEVEVSPDANDHYGAFRVGIHDDLVTALGLAVQRPPSGRVEHSWMGELSVGRGRWR